MRLRYKRKIIIRNIAIGLSAFVLLFVVFGYFLIYRPYTKIKAKGLVLANSAQQLKADFKQNDIDLVKKRLGEINGQYDDFEKEAKTVYWAAFIPYISDFKNGVEAGDYLLSAANESVTAIEPYADLIGFKKGNASFVEKTSEERLQTAVLTLDKMLVRIGPISKDIDEAEKRIAKIDPNRYPEKIGDRVVRANIVIAKQQFSGVSSLFVDAQPFLKKLPEILGSTDEKTYLILFQNIYEERPTGGFLTFYAVMNINKGKINFDKSSDIYDLDASIPNHPPAPEKIKMYHKNVNQFFIRDSNLSPDFVESVKLFESLYKNSQQKVDYDGIIAMDAKVLVDMLTIFGDTTVDGINFTATKDKRCDCPQVIYTLFDVIDRPVNYIKVDRKRLLGNLMQDLFFKAVGFSPSKYWGRLFENMLTNLDEKHILLYFTDADVQKSVESLNYAGRIREFEGDYLHVNNANMAGAKSNLFVEETLISETSFENGLVKRTMKYEFKNPYPHSDCNLERGGLCLNAILRNWMRVYVPEGSKLVKFEGSQTEVLTYDELGKTVFEGFLTVNPEGKADVIVEYTLPKTITEANYKLMIQKQPGNEKLDLEVEINGKNKFNGKFDGDKVLE